MNNKYLLEIGTEELPAREINPALEQLKKKLEEMFLENRIVYDDINLYATPRRLTALISGLADRQATLEENIKGPKKAIAFDKDGNPSKALEGFMRGKNLSLGEISFEDLNGEEYVYGKVVEEGRPTEEIIQKEIGAIIKSISFTKTMRWGGKNLRFARPIRWILSLYNTEVLDFELEGIPVSNVTKGHRFLGSSHIEINSVDEYEDKLKENYCIVDQRKRREIIEFESNRLVKEKGGNLLVEEELFEEVTNIVEYPTPAIGEIKEEYLKLPKDVIITPMKEHLRFFPVADDSGELLPYFVTIRNGNREHIDTVIKGNEKVLGARLEDAIFFYEDDISQNLEAYVEDLKNIVFQEKLGTVYEKTVRLEELTAKIADYLGVGEETKSNLSRAAKLSKADLVTKMVDEFSELQGKMGMEYALQSGENEIVSRSLFEQYLPRFAGDILPKTTAGAILAIADKMDTIAGSFAIGVKPTSSQDPYGLRRNALGIINIILDKNLSLSLEAIIDFALYIYVEENGLVFNYEEVKREIIDFFNIRIRTMFIDMGVRYDLVDALLSTDVDNVYDFQIRAEKLGAYLEEDSAKESLETFNRVISLSKKADSIDINDTLFQEKEEVDLYNSLNNLQEDFDQALDNKKYDQAMRILGSLKGPVDNFFDNVMVMVDDEEIKNNRLSLIGKISDNMLKVCDLSKIVK